LDSNSAVAALAPAFMDFFYRMLYVSKYEFV